jgi:hypothetical protein
MSTTLTPISAVHNDETNPRKPDEARMALLRLSIARLGFLMPLYVTKEGMLLSGHQRTAVTLSLGIDVVPTEVVDIDERKIKGINVVFNRATNDFGAMDTGSTQEAQLDLKSIITEIEMLDPVEPEDWPAMKVEELPIKGMAETVADRYDKKAEMTAIQLMKLGIRIPIVITRSGRVVNGVHRLFAARAKGITKWPIVTIEDKVATLATKLLNYLSMDFSLDEDYKDLLRSCAFRRPQNNRGNVPKAMRYWASGMRTVSDKDTYTDKYWCTFREKHGESVLDFGSGLSKAAPFLRKKGIDATDFEPFRIDFDGTKMEPCVEYSREQARAFLKRVADGQYFDSLFLCSVLNSIPFPEDRLKVLCIVHALCGHSSVVYGTCRDISDYTYEYSGIRQANYFKFDTEDGVRIGDVMSNPKIQKFHTQDEIAKLLRRFWLSTDTYSGGNVFYWEASSPKQVNTAALALSLEFEFNLPFKDGERMGLVKEAKAAFSKRLGKKIP